MKRQHLLATGLGTAALLIAGAAVASPPSGHTFNNWASFEGRVILNPDGNDLAAVVEPEDFASVGSNCTPPACVVLLNEVGMLQARVRADDDPEAMGYFQTITVEDNFTGVPSGAAFRNESFVEATNLGFPMSTLNYVEMDDDGFTQAYLNSGAMQEAGQPFMELYQVGTFPFADVNFYFERMARSGPQFSTSANAGARLRIDYLPSNITGERQAAMTIRQASGFYTQEAGTLALADGTEVEFAAGDHIGTVFGVGRTWHGGNMHTDGSNLNRHFEMQAISNYSANDGAGITENWVSGGSTMDDTGVGAVTFTAMWNDAYALDARLWNEDAFGPAPNYTAVDGGVDVGTLFPGAPVHDDFLTGSPSID